MCAAILTVDDQQELLDNIALTLRAAGYTVLTATDGVDALEVLRSQPVDLILADIAMRRMNGYQLYQQIRENQAWVAIPFLFLTARAMDSDIRYGKELGVDDYLTKPIEPEDLLAAVQGKLRRTQQLAALAQPPPVQLAHEPPAHEPPALILGRLQIHMSQHRVWMDGQAVKLSAREFTVLAYLAQRAGDVVAPHALIKASHGLATDNIEAGELLRPLVRSLRRKLGHPVGEPGCIENVRGVGYRLIALDYNGDLRS
jgi:DNA-binding response OmpR family regulator